MNQSSTPLEAAEAKTKSAPAEVSAMLWSHSGPQPSMTHHFLQLHRLHIHQHKHVTGHLQV